MRWFPSTVAVVVACAAASVSRPSTVAAQVGSTSVADGSAGAGGAPQTSDQPSGRASAAGGLPSIQSTLGPFGDPGDLRASLANLGITYGLVLTAETIGNLTGGIRRGAIGEGLLDLNVDVDLEKALHVGGATLHANGFKIFGDGLGRSDLLDLSLPSGIEALPSTRLYEAWYEQSMLDGKVRLRVGQLGASYEFLVSEYADHFLNSTFYWTDLANYDLPSAGPSYPLATPGIRLRVAVDDRWTLLTGVFDGDPAGAARLGPGANAQKLDRYGTSFRVTDPPLLMSEVAYSHGGGAGEGLPGTVKFGVWKISGSFPAMIRTSTGSSFGPGAGRLHGDQGAYGLVDQTVYRSADSGTETIGVFARLSGAPSDRNLISLYADAGVLAKGVVPGRPDDAVGASFAFAQVSAAARRSDHREAIALGIPYPIRSNELVFELTYQTEVVSGFNLQPDFQYVVRPGGGIPAPFDATYHPVRDAAVLGLRASMRY